MERSSVKRRAGGGWGHFAELRQFGSLPIAGHLWRGTPVGSWVVGGQGNQGPMTLGLLEGFQLPGQHATPTDTQEGRETPAQALGGLHPGAIVEKLAHGVSGEVVLGGEGPVKGCQLPSSSPQPAGGSLGNLRGSDLNLSRCQHTGSHRALTRPASGQGPQWGTHDKHMTYSPAAFPAKALAAPWSPSSEVRALRGSEGTDPYRKHGRES